MLITWTYFSVLKYIIHTHYLLYSNMSTFFFFCFTQRQNRAKNWGPIFVTSVEDRLLKKDMHTFTKT